MSNQPVQDAEVQQPAAPVQSTPSIQLPEDVPSLHALVKSLASKVMAHSQTVQELLRANMDLRAALHLVQADKGQLEAYIKSLLAPPVPAKNEEPVSDAPATTPVENAADANSVQP